MTELLGEVRVKYESQATVDAALHAIKAALEGLKPAKEQQVLFSVFIFKPKMLV